jgi:general secretion pathway protein A
MYLDFYHFQKGPFHITPDPEFLFLSPSHKDALGTIIYGIEQRKGFVAIIGEVGLGKTTIIRSYLERVDPKQVKPIYIFNPQVSFAELLRTIYREFGLEPHTEDLLELVNHLYEVLLAEHQAGRNIVLVIDEAQNMPVETLENLRMLSNLETPTDKLLQILLVGQPEFEQKLTLQTLRQLRQRIAIRARILPLTPAESMAYIHHRLAKVALRRGPIFTAGALKRIVKQAKGVPRVINILCDNALISGFGYQQKPVTTRIVKEVIADFVAKKRHPLLRWGLAVMTILLLGVGLLRFAPYQNVVLDHMKSGRFSTIMPMLQSPFRLAKKLWSPEEGVIPKKQPFAVLPHTAPEPAGGEKGSSTPAQVLADPPIAQPSSTLGQDTTGQQENKPSLSLTAEKIPAQNAEEGLKTPLALGETAITSQTLPSDASTNTPSTIKRIDTTPPSVTIKTVREGDSLSKLIIETYGFANETVIDWVKKHNPHIQDVNRIFVGEKVSLPPLPTAESTAAKRR